MNASLRCAARDTPPSRHELILAPFAARAPAWSVGQAPPHTALLPFHPSRQVLKAAVGAAYLLAIVAALMGMLPFSAWTSAVAAYGFANQMVALAEAHPDGAPPPRVQCTTRSPAGRDEIQGACCLAASRRPWPPHSLTCCCSHVATHRGNHAATHVTCNPIAHVHAPPTCARPSPTHPPTPSPPEPEKLRPLKQFAVKWHFSFGLLLAVGLVLKTLM